MSDVSAVTLSWGQANNDQAVSENKECSLVALLDGADAAILSFKAFYSPRIDAPVYAHMTR